MHIARAYIPVDDGGLQIAKLLSKKGKRRKKNNEKGRERRIQRNRKKKKKGKRKRQALVVALIEHPANTFGTRSTNLWNEIQDVSRHTVIGRLMNSRPFFFFRKRMLVSRKGLTILG